MFLWTFEWNGPHVPLWKFGPQIKSFLSFGSCSDRWGSLFTGTLQLLTLNFWVVCLPLSVLLPSFILRLWFLYLGPTVLSDSARHHTKYCCHSLSTEHLLQHGFCCVVFLAWPRAWFVFLITKIIYFFGHNSSSREQCPNIPKCLWQVFHVNKNCICPSGPTSMSAYHEMLAIFIRYVDENGEWCQYGEALLEHGDLMFLHELG